MKLTDLDWIEGKPPAEVLWNGVVCDDDWDPSLVPFLARTEDGTIWSIGDANNNGGTCDCCQRIGRQDIVAYARIIIEGLPVNESATSH